MAVVTRVSIRDLRRKMDAGKPLLILDARRGIDACAPRIPGAVHVDTHHLNPTLFKLDPATEVVVYDHSPHEEVSTQIVEALLNAGYRAEALLGGWDQWKDSGFPIEVPQAAVTPAPEPSPAPPVTTALDRVETVVGDLAKRALQLVHSLFQR